MAHEQTISVRQEQIQLGNAGRGLATAGLALAVVGFAGACFVGLRNPEDAARVTHFWHAYLMAFAFFLAISLGALFFVMVHHLARAGWSVLIRRVAECLASNVLLMGFLFLPIMYLGATGKLTILYHWADPALVNPHSDAYDKLLAGKAGYLNVPFFMSRVFGFLIFWTILAFFLRHTSVRQDTTGDVALSRRMEWVSAPGMMLFGITLTLGAFDLLMTLNPHWFSTMWGVYFFATCCLAFFSTIVLLLLTLQKLGVLGDLITTEHFHDLGKWMFTFTFFWGYIAFSQYMLIWYANIPEETQFYLPRQIGPWGAMALALIFVHLLIPFPGLLSRHVKRKMPVLAFWAIWSLGACLLDLFWIVMPNSFINKIPQQVDMPHASLQEALPKLVESGTGAMGPGIYGLNPVHSSFMNEITYAIYQPQAWFVTLGLVVGMGGLYLAATVYFLKSAALVPLKDPRLPESIAFENA